MTEKIHGEYFTEVGRSGMPGGNVKDVTLEARAEDDGTVWVKVSLESSSGKRVDRLISKNIEVL